MEIMQFRGLKKIHNLKLEVAEREWIIQKKDELVVQANRNRDDFLKEKYVRDIRIDTLKEKLQPLEIRYKRMVDVYIELEAILDRKNRTIEQTQKVARGLSKRCLGLSKEIKCLREKRDKALRMVKKMKTAIHSCAAIAYEPKSLCETVLNMYQIFISSETEKSIQKEMNETAEFMHQRRHLEASVKHLQEIVKKRPKLIVNYRRSSPIQTHYTSRILSEMDWLKHQLREEKTKTHYLEKLVGVEKASRNYLNAKESFEKAVKITKSVKKKQHVEIWHFKLAVNLLLKELEERSNINTQLLKSNIYKNYGCDIGRQFAKVISKRGLSSLEQHIMNLTTDMEEEEEEEEEEMEEEEEQEEEEKEEVFINNEGSSTKSSSDH